MSRRVLIFDTSALCCWLNIPGKEHAGPANDRWDHVRVQTLLDAESAADATFVLPMASLIETGNHIAQARVRRFELATEFATYLRAAAEEATPWAAFTEQSPLWGKENLLTLAETWPRLAAGGTSLGDATIKHVAEYYAKAG